MNRIAIVGRLALPALTTLTGGLLLLLLRPACR